MTRHIRTRMERYGQVKRECGLLQALLESGALSEEEMRMVRTQLILEESKLEGCLAEAESLIQRVPNRRHLREILRLRYLMLMKWESISECLMLEKRWVMRLHNRALEHIAQVRQ